jgi:hypothetical protein
MPRRPSASAAPEEPKAAAEAPPEEKEPTAEEYETHRAEVLARLPAEKDRPANIYARLAQINGLIGMIRKTGRNTFHNYRYAKESDLVEEIRPILAAYGIWIEQGLYSDPDNGFFAHQRMNQKIVRQGNIIGEGETLTAITKRFRFVWWNPEAKALETTEWEPFMGYGDDTGDKGYYKAETGAVKYFLMKTFMVATGDDPEGDTRADQRASTRDAGGRVDVQPRRQGSRQAEPGGRQQDASAPQLKTVGELLGQLNARQAAVAIPLVEELTGLKVEIADPEDIPGAFVTFMQALKPDVVGKLIYDLRKRVEALPTASDQAATESEAADGSSDDAGGAAASEPVDEPTDDGTVESAIA